MKFLQANLVTALLAATTFAAPSAAARLKHLREGEGDLKKFEKKSMDELLKDVRRLADADDIDFANFANVDVASMMEEFKGSIPDIEFHHKGSSSSSNDEDEDPSPQCYIGVDFLEKKFPGWSLASLDNTDNPDPNVICCAMSDVYYSNLFSLLKLLEDFGLIPSGSPEKILKLLYFGGHCSTTRPPCYSTGTQMTFWQFHTAIYDFDGETDYPVCEGAVISPGEFFIAAPPPDNTNFAEFVLGYLDSPVVVSIPGLHLHCPSEDCTFNGGQFHIASFAELPIGTVDDISGLTIEGFTFTGTMTSAPNEVDQNKYSIFLGAPGTNVVIENNVFRDIINPIEDGVNCNVTREYTAIHAQEPVRPEPEPETDSVPSSSPSSSPSFVAPSSQPSMSPSGFDRALQVTIENNVFENIDVGSYPVYANNPKYCDLCFKETNMRYANPGSFILNQGQDVSLVDNTFKKNVANELYYAMPIDIDDCGGNCYKATIRGNTFYKNVVVSIITLIKPENADVSFDGNEGECKQSYTGSMYCPVRRFNDEEGFDFFDLLRKGFRPFQNEMSPLENCDGTEFCFSENRASMLNRVDQNVCGEW